MTTNSVTFHDLFDPLAGQHCSIRFEGGKVAERHTTLPGGGFDIDSKDLWLLPGLYDADQHLPLAHGGVRPSDRAAALAGGITLLNTALQWQDVRNGGLGEIVEGAAAEHWPRIVPVLSVGDEDSAGFADWIGSHAPEVVELMPAVCKLYSADPLFLEHFDAVISAGLMPIVYCYDGEALDEVIARHPAKVHFRHAVTAELVDRMSQLPGASLQTSPHYLLPIPEAHREQLWVLPPVGDDDTRLGLAKTTVDGIDLLVTDHSPPPPVGHPNGPGLMGAHTFLPAVLATARLYGWDLTELLAKCRDNPAALFGVSLGESFVIVDPNEPASTRWPRQDDNRAAFAHTPLAGQVVAAASGDHGGLL